MSTLRVFLKWPGSSEALPENLYNKVIVPRVAPEERQRDETLDPEDAQKILQYLSKFDFSELGCGGNECIGRSRNSCSVSTSLSISRQYRIQIPLCSVPSAQLHRMESSRLILIG